MATQRELNQVVLDVLNGNFGKGEFAKFSTRAFCHVEEATVLLRSHLPAPFNTFHLDAIRKAAHNASGKLRDNVKRLRESKATPRERIWKAGRSHQPPKEFSPEYLDYIQGDVWKERASRHRRECNWMCQLCAETFQGKDLDVHHVIYGEFDGSEHWSTLLCLCRPCHGVADTMRKEGGVNALFESI